MPNLNVTDTRVLLTTAKESGIRNGIRLSFNQERLWFIDQKEGSVQYHEPAVLRLRGTLDTPALASAFRQIVNRHEVLRTVITETAGIPYQHVLPANGWDLEIIDEPLIKQDADALQQRIRALTDAAFDLSRDHMLRASLIVLTEAEYLLVVTMHHIAVDGWSKGILIQELKDFYDACIHGDDAQPTPLPMQYTDYAMWQRTYITGSLLEEQLNYWKNKLQGVTPLDLPTDHTRPAVQSNRGAVITFSVEPALEAALNRFSRQQKVTLFITMLTAFKVLLYRYSGQTDICVGTPVAGRTRKEIRGLVGFFINTLALRSNLDDDPSFSGLLQQVKQTTREALDNQDAPIERIVEQVLDNRDPGRSPLFQVIFGYQPSPAKAEGLLGAAAMAEEEYYSTASKLDLVFTMEDHASGLTGTVMYCTDLYQELTIRRMIGHFQQLLQSAVEAPETRISALTLLTPPEIPLLQDGINQSSVTYPLKDSQTIVQLCEAAAAQTPDAVALAFEGNSFTYRGLEERANQLAHYLQAIGVRSGALVPLCMERSPDMIVGILGILKAGGAYVPIEPDYPQERIRFLLQDTGAAVVVSSEACAANLPDNITVVIPDPDDIMQQLFPGTPLQHTADIEQPAYVIYTSGSTGNPKGVMVTHRNLVDYIYGLRAALPLELCRSYGLLSGIATDLGNTVIYAALSSGATLHLFSKETVNDAEKLQRYFTSHTVDCIKIVPSHWKALSMPDRLLVPRQLLIFGGESLEAAVAAQIRLAYPACTVVNHYGPTETTIGKLLHVVKADTTYNGVIPIGKPFGNTVIYVLDAAKNLCPLGIPGELYIGGAGVAHGYLHNDALTAERFIDDPFRPGRRLYRTGDLVKYLPDGNVVFLGRADEQVKIRGYRVEPGEIERALNRAPGINGSVVAVRTDASGSRRLAGYVLTDAHYDEEAVLALLRQQLPEYMIPSALVSLEAFPMLPNGKIDRKSLPDPDSIVTAANVYTAPRNKWEQTMANIWEAVLGIERVGIHDNYFDLGGDSILSIQVVSRVRKEGYELQIGDLFEYQTIAALHTALVAKTGAEDALTQSTSSTVATSALTLPDEVAGPGELDAFLDTQLPAGDIRRNVITGIYRLSGLQEGMLFHALYEGPGGAYTNQFTFGLDAPDIGALLQAWQHLLSRHSILRSSFHHDVFRVPVQCVHTEVQLPVTMLDYREMNTAEQEGALAAFEQAGRAKGFDLAEPPLMRLALIQLSETQYRMVWTFHHLLLDGWSLPVLMNELLQAYELLVTGSEPPSAEEDRYEDYIRYLESYDKDAAAEYWQQYLSGIDHPTLLPFTGTGAERSNGKGLHDTCTLTLDAGKTDRITAFARKNRLTVNTVMQAIWACLLYRHTGNMHITFGVTVSGRPDDLPGVEKRVGMYINTLPLHTMINKDRGIVQWMQELQQEQIQSRRYQHTPLNESRRWAGISGDLFDTLLVFENYPLDVLNQAHSWRLKTTGMRITEHTNYPLSVSIEAGAEMRLTFIYNSGLLPAVYVQQLSAAFSSIVDQLIMHSTGTLEDIIADQRQQEAFNQTNVPYPKDAAVIELFEAQVRLHPHQTALVAGAVQLTYLELDNRSNQVAQLLMDRGVSTGSNVGLLAFRGAEMVTAILGILKSGCAYVPLHTGYPAERLAIMVEDAGLSHILYTDEEMFVASGLSGKQGIPVAAAGGYPADAVPVKVSPDDCIYIMYTSGTTGRPKGIAVNHRPVVKLVTDPGPIAILPEDTVLQWSNYAFDGSVYDIFGALLCGARLCMISDAAAADVFQLSRIIREQRVTVAFITTALFNSFVDSDAAGLLPLRKLLFGGEAVSQQHVEKAFALLGAGRLVHMYGPTETTVYATYYPVNELPEAVIPIGRPLANTRVLILDGQGLLTAPGVNGELYIGGDGIAMGYINNEHLTAERFLWLEKQDGRWYRTGDTGYWQSDGNIVYTGRSDQQVKIRGYRVEPEEIAAVLQQCSLVSQAVVLVKEGPNSHRKLAGYILPSGEFDREGILAWLRTRLPDYMIPSQLVPMNSWPLNANGKIDRQALPEPEETLSADKYTAPRTAVERALAEVWEALLGVHPIGLYDNFFELGGDSILSIQVVSRAKRSGYTLQPRDLFLHQTIAELSAVVTADDTYTSPAPVNGDHSLEGLISREELDRFLDTQLPAGGTLRNAVSSVYRLSGLQEGMLFHGLYERGTETYIEQFSCYLHAPDIAVFVQSWEHLLARHSILRSGFYHDAFRVPVQCVHKQVQLPVIRQDYRGMDAPAQNAACLTFAAAERARGFDLSKPPLMRLGLLQLSDTQYRLVWTFHHLLIDGWSMPVLIEELLQTYEQLLKGSTLSAAAEDRYEDYIRYLETRDREAEEAYWQQYLSNIDQPTLLPFIQAGSERSHGKGVYCTYTLTFDAGMTSRIQAFAQRHHLTVNTVMQGVWAYLLYRYTGNSHVTYGVTVSGRPAELPGIEQRVGLYINTIPLHTEIAEERTTVSWLEQLQQEQAQSRRYQHTPLNESQRQAGIGGALFDTLLVFENYPVSEMVLSDRWMLHVSDPQMEEHTNYPLSITITTGASINIIFKHNAGFIAKDYVIQLGRHFEQVADQFLSAPGGRLADITLLTDADLRQLKAFNDTSATYPGDITIAAQFTAQAQLRPQHTALISGVRRLSYRELDARSWQLAHYLRSIGVEAGHLIAVCMERDMDIVTAMLGVLKAGGAYVPIDPGYPAQRISYMLSDCEATVVLCSKTSELKIAGISPGICLVTLDEKAIADCPDQPFGVVQGADALAYVIYTSGSTGTPKGVMVTQRGVLNLVHWHIGTYKVTAASKATAVAGVGFDAFGWELWPYLLSGASVMLLGDEQRLDAASLVQEYGSSGITHSFLPTGLVASFIDASRDVSLSLQYLLTGGDHLPYTSINGISYQVVNNYGPTENSVVTTYYPLQEQQAITAPPIGKPVSNTKVYITDGRMRLLPAGAAGEICISGAGLATGYLHRADLTAARFIPDPFSNEAGARLYLSGDTGYRLPDGNIVYLGRKDEQVKIRGYRIEPGEITQVLLQSTMVKQAMVVVHTTEGGHKRLVGYVIPSGDFDGDSIISYLRERLPDYMIPVQLIPLKQWPLTANGKIDRQALPNPGGDTLNSEHYAAPKTRAEHTLADIWRELLRVERIGIYDNFFSLGGDSILSLQFVSRAKQAGYALQPRDIFQYPTIAALSDLLDRQEEQASSGEQGILTGSSGLLPVQQWFFETGSTSHFNHSVLLAIDKSVDATVLSAAIQQLVIQHDSLRFAYNNGKQAYAGNVDPFTLVNLQSLLSADLPGALAEQGAIYQSSLDISTGAIFRAVLFLTPAATAQNRLLLIIHHLAIDGVSWRILLDDLGLLLDGCRLGRKGSSYRQWHHALMRYSSSKRLLDQEPYWTEIIQHYRPLQADGVYEAPLRITDMDSCQVRLSVSLTRQLLKEASRAYHTEINDLLLSALASVLCTWLGGPLLIGLEGHGREDIDRSIDVSRTVGWFTSLYPVLLDDEGAEEPGRLIKAVKERLRQVPDKGLGYGVLKYLTKAAALQGEDPWDITFNYLGQFDALFNRQGLFTPVDEYAGPATGEDYIIRRTLAINSMVAKGELVVDWNYSRHHFTSDTIAALAEQYIRSLRSLIQHTVSRASRPVFTPADLGLGGQVSHTALDAFLDTPGPSGGTRREAISGMYRLSSLQEGMLFHGLYDDAAEAYIEQFSCYLQAPDIAVFVQSWQHLLARHSILRSGFYHDAFRVPVQCVYKQVQLPVIRLDYREMDTRAQEAACTAFAAAERARGFDFSQPPLMRLGLLQLSDTQYRLVWTFHHLLIDGWSMPVLIEELLQTYDRLMRGDTLHEAAEDRYEDYIRYLETRDKEAEEAYWRQYLSNIDRPTLLPFIQAGSERSYGQGVYSNHTLTLDAGMTSRIQAFAQGHRLTVNTVMQGVWAYLLYRYTGNRHVIYGVTVSGRPADLPGVEQRVGMYINTIPLHTAIDEERMIVSWLDQLQQEQAQSRRYQHTPLNEIQRWANIGEALFDTLLIFENYPVGEMVLSDRWILRVSDPQMEEHNNYPLNIIITTGESVNIIFKYNSSFIGGDHVMRLVRHFEQAVDQFLSAANGKLGDITLLTATGDELPANIPDTYVSSSGKLTARDCSAPRNAMEQALAEIWKDLLGIRQVGVYDDLFALGADSLLLIRAAAAIREVMDTDVMIGELFEHPTIAALALLMEGRQGLKQLTANKHLLPLNRGKENRSIFLLPGQQGVSEGYEELALALQPAGLMYGIQQQGVYEGEMPQDSIPAMAARYLRWIKEVQPEGPYRLIGHSFGSYVAFEIARQLMQEDEKVEYLIILDAAAHPHRVMPEEGQERERFLQNIAATVEDRYPVMAAGQEGGTAHKVFVSRLLQLTVNNIALLDNYLVTGRLHTKLVLVKAAEAGWEEREDCLGWEAHGTQVRSVTAPGDHFSMLQRRHAALLWQELRELLLP
jgi:amino acid adenylation domain-containing protein/non-ribosomal peptide synthase protein (TIGR01720 family)